MKNELTLKHGVILAAAVLLIAGIAFAGAVAADDEPVYVTWSDSNITSDGGNYLVNVTDNKITAIHANGYFVIKNDLTLDFQNAKLYFDSEGSSSSGIIAYKFATNGSNLTIKNLIIDGGNGAFTRTSGSGVLIGHLNSERPDGTTGRGVVIIQNLSISNLSVLSSQYWIGGLIGCLGPDSTCLIENVTIDNCSISGLDHCGGFIGRVYTNAALCIKNCTISNTSICCEMGGYSAPYSGGLISYSDYPLKIENTVIKNCFISSNSTSQISSSAGLYVTRNCNALANKWELNVIGCPYDHCEIVNNTIHNCVITGTRIAGGLLSGQSVSASYGYVHTKDIITGNKLSYNTIVAGSKAAGFISGYGSTSNTLTINSNSVRSCCVVATNGDAAGFCV